MMLLHLSPYLPAFITQYKQINWDDHVFLRCLCLVIAAPLIWNIVARTIRSILPKRTSTTIRYLICYALTIWIFSFSTFRDIYFHRSVESQPQGNWWANDLIRYAISAPLFIAGQTFVLSSFYRLGITGTFLGDYCGILMDERVTGFPFNVLENPMYVGSTMSFLAYSLYYSSWAGLVITLEVYIVYTIALMFEGPYTTQIYAEREAERAKAAKKVE